MNDLWSIISRFKKWQFDLSTLTHLVPVLPSYRNQSIDFHSKSIDWDLSEGYTRI